MNNCTDLQDRKTFLEGEKQNFGESCFFEPKSEFWPVIIALEFKMSEKMLTLHIKTHQSWCASQLDPK